LALTNCRNCGGTVSSHAATCPHCGYAQKKPPYVAIGMLLLAALAVVLLIVSFVNRPKENESNSRYPSNYDYNDNYNYTTPQSSALEKAKSYLRMGGFSKADLEDQLLYHGFSQSEVDYAIRNCNANWKEQSLIKAKSYLRMGGFSKEDLIEQLEYHEFLSSEIDYAIANCNANWKQQALIKAKSYLKMDKTWTRSSLRRQLEYHGFTYEEIQYALNNCGI
jgi:SOS response regulatory protein OraA/RecX